MNHASSTKAIGNRCATDTAVGVDAAMETWTCGCGHLHHYQPYRLEMARTLKVTCHDCQDTAILQATECHDLDDQAEMGAASGRSSRHLRPTILWDGPLWLHERLFTLEGPPANVCDLPPATPSVGDVSLVT
jgi:hypothetical protein